jgi:hypothetical protein
LETKKNREAEWLKMLSFFMHYNCNFSNQKLAEFALLDPIRGTSSENIESNSGWQDSFFS